MKAFDEKVRRQLKRDLPRIARGVASSFGAKLECEYYMGYPPTVNDPEMTVVAREAARAAVGRRAVIDGEPTMGAEDMSNAKPVEVRLSPFQISKYPVTNAAYRRFVESGQDPPADWEDGKIPEGKENHPVLEISFSVPVSVPALSPGFQAVLALALLLGFGAAFRARSVRT